MAPRRRNRRKPFHQHFTAGTTEQAHALILGATITSLRWAAKLSLSALAFGAGVSEDTLAQVEAGTGTLTLWELRAVGQALGRTEPGDLLDVVECALHKGERWVPGPRNLEWAATAIEATWHCARVEDGKVVWTDGPFSMRKRSLARARSRNLASPPTPGDT